MLDKVIRVPGLAARQFIAERTCSTAVSSMRRPAFTMPQMRPSGATATCTKLCAASTSAVDAASSTRAPICSMLAIKIGTGAARTVQREVTRQSAADFALHMLNFAG